MKTNVGMFDRWLRLVIGFALILLAFAGTIGSWGYIGVVPVTTALVGWCPAYRLLGMDTWTARPGPGR